MAYDPKYGGVVLQTTGAPATTSGQNGDIALDTATAGGPYIYVKSAGAWGTAISLKGTAGVAGNLLRTIPVTGAYNVTSADFSTGIPVYLLNAGTANVPLTADAAVLWTGTNGLSLYFIVVRVDNSATYSATIVAGGTSETINGATSIALPVPYQAREVFAASPTALIVK